MLALDPEPVWSWIDLCDLYVITGGLDQAILAFRKAMAVATRPAQAEPGNAGWQRDLAMSHNKIGEVQQAQGDLAAALASYWASLAMRQRLAQGDPDNADWQRDLTISNGQVALIAARQGNRESALKAFRIE